MQRILLALVIAMTVLKPTLAHQWQTLCPDNQFCFDYPAELVAGTDVAVDSTAGKLSSDKLEITYDYGLYSSDYRELSDSKTSQMLIDGKQATVFTTSQVIALHIAEVKPVPVMNSSLKLSIGLRFSDKADQKLAQKLFDSIRFSAK